VAEHSPAGVVCEGLLGARLVRLQSLHHQRLRARP
jgi:hypothetical protein